MHPHRLSAYNTAAAAMTALRAVAAYLHQPGLDPVD
jgi:hypothetical protein